VLVDVVVVVVVCCAASAANSMRLCCILFFLGDGVAENLSASPGFGVTGTSEIDEIENDNQMTKNQLFTQKMQPAKAGCWRCLKNQEFGKEVASERCWFSSGTGDAKAEVVAAIEYIEQMCQTMH